jgi:hypothetical protein
LENAVERLLKQKSQFAPVQAAAPATQVVGVRDGQIYLDSGENGGLRVGQRLTVMRLTDVIRDARGNVLDEITEKVATIEVPTRRCGRRCRQRQRGAQRAGAII